MKTFKQISALIADRDDKAWCDKVYAINNEFGIIAIVYADNEQDALDSAVDNGKLDSQLMSEADHKEYESKGWDDSFCYAGNAGEPIWTEYLGITELNRDKSEHVIYPYPPA
jgi:hypothetical protein